MTRPKICLQKKVKVVKVGWVEEWKPTLKILHTDEVKKSSLRNPTEELLGFRQTW
jgi:hypothetical protein